MIKQTRIRKIWTRTIINLVLVDVLALAILISFVVQRLQGNAAPTYSVSAAILVGIALFSFILYLVMRSIRNAIGRRFGEDG